VWTSKAASATTTTQQSFHHIKVSSALKYITSFDNENQWMLAAAFKTKLVRAFQW